MSRSRESIRTIAEGTIDRTRMLTSSISFSFRRRRFVAVVAGSFPIAKNCLPRRKQGGHARTYADRSAGRARIRHREVSTGVAFRTPVCELVCTSCKPSQSRHTQRMSIHSAARLSHAFVFVVWLPRASLRFAYLAKSFQGRFRHRQQRARTTIVVSYAEASGVLRSWDAVAESFIAAGKARLRPRVAVTPAPRLSRLTVSFVLLSRIAGEHAP